jgi:primosomal protein N''
MSAEDLRATLAEAIRDVRTKKMSPRIASAISQLCNSSHRILPTADFEARLAELEQDAADQKSRNSGETDPAGSHRTDETRYGAHAQTGGVSTPRSDEAQGMDDESGEGGEA